MEITGQLKEIFETQNVSDKFQKREFVLTDNSSQYPQHILIQTTQDKCSLLDRFKVGDTIIAHINLRGRSWTSPKNEVKYFNTIEAWRLVAGTGSGSNDSSANENTSAAETFTASTQEDDLPF